MANASSHRKWEIKNGKMVVAGFLLLLVGAEGKRLTNRQRWRFSLIAAGRGVGATPATVREMVRWWRCHQEATKEYGGESQKLAGYALSASIGSVDAARYAG